MRLLALFMTCIAWTGSGEQPHEPRDTEGILHSMKLQPSLDMEIPNSLQTLATFLSAFSKPAAGLRRTLPSSRSYRSPSVSLMRQTDDLGADALRRPGISEATLVFSRRAALTAAAVAAAASIPAWRPASAFNNRLPPDELELKYKTPRQPGPKPGNIGTTKGELKPCTDGKPHCFSSTPEVLEFDYGTTDDWLVKPFKYDKPLADAVADLKSAIAAYPPGQRGIDGGGFQLITDSINDDVGYLYVQFESQRKGYIDDMEFALRQGVVNVRTSSRLGYLDLGVNAKRFNWFAEKMGKTPGWTTFPLLAKDHPQYFELNSLTDKILADTSGGMVRATEKVRM